MKQFFKAIMVTAPLCGCSAIRQVPIETIHQTVTTDTLHLTHQQYDSIHVGCYTHVEKIQGIPDDCGVRVDTFIKGVTNYEYKYRHIRDTLWRTRTEYQRDSIPYEVRVEVEKVIKHTPWYTQALAWLGGIILLLGASATAWLFLRRR